MEALYRTAWDEIASHFHPPTRQWAGPHSRCYSTLLGRGTLALIQRATDGRVNFGANRAQPHRAPSSTSLPRRPGGPTSRRWTARATWSRRS